MALLPLFVALLAEARERSRWPLLVEFLVLYYLVCDLTNEELLGKGSKTLLQALSVVTWGNVALLAVTLVLASSAAGERPGADQGSQARGRAVPVRTVEKGAGRALLWRVSSPLTSKPASSSASS